MLGRILAIDSSLALGPRAASSAIAGLLQNNLGLNVQGVSIAMGLLAGTLFIA